MNTTVWIVVALIVVLAVSNRIYEWYLTRRCPNCGNRLETIIVFDRQGSGNYFQCSDCLTEFRVRGLRLTPKTDSNATSNSSDAST